MHAQTKDQRMAAEVRDHVWVTVKPVQTKNKYCVKRLMLLNATLDDLIAACGFDSRMTFSLDSSGKDCVDRFKTLREIVWWRDDLRPLPLCLFVNVSW